MGRVSGGIRTVIRFRAGDEAVRRTLITIEAPGARDVRPCRAGPPQPRLATPALRLQSRLSPKFVRKSQVSRTAPHRRSPQRPSKYHKAPASAPAPVITGHQPDIEIVFLRYEERGGGRG